MSLSLKSQLAQQLPLVSENEGSNYFTQILLKKEKTLDDAHMIYEKIKGFSSFHDFFAGNLNKLDMAKILNVCQGFKYEKGERGDFIFKQGDPSNDKFYIILRGEVAVMNNQRLGDFGTALPVSLKGATTMNSLTARDHTLAKQPLVQSARDLERKIPSLKAVESLGGEAKKPLHKLERLSAHDERDVVESSQSQSISKTKVASKMRKVYDAVKALRTMQKCLPGFKKAAGSLTEIENKEPPGTLQYLDEAEDKEETDRKEFEALASSYGKIIQYLGVGESFGELASKKNAKRHTGILCRTDAEFLVLEKQQFDEVFGKIEREREEFLKSVFPLLTSISSANYTFLVCCFKTERFSKGSYIINEGLRTGKAKFYIIQSGECVLEKKVPRKVKGTVNLKQRSDPLYDNIQVTLAGKGSIIGEEILDPQEHYEYSVKVISETVIVQAITKKDFRYRFPQDFQEYVTSLYETKREHRESILNAPKDFHYEKDEPKGNNPSANLANSSISHLATKSAKNCFSRYLQRETKFDVSSVLKTTISPRAAPASHRESSLPSIRDLYSNEGGKDNQSHTFRGPSIEREAGLVKSEKMNPKDRVSMKIDFLNKITSPRKQSGQEEEMAKDTAGFFAQFQNDKDRRTIKIRLAHMTKQLSKLEKKETDEVKGNRDSANLFINKFMSKKDEIEFLQKTSLNHIEADDTIETTKPVVIVTKSLAQSRRGSIKAGSLVDLNSLYHQKLSKGRPSIRQLSPGSLKTSDNNSKPISLNEIPSKANLDTVPSKTNLDPQPEMTHPRRTGTNASWSLQTLKIYPETERAIGRKKVASKCELDEDCEKMVQRMTTEEGDHMTGKLLEKERIVLKERTIAATNVTKKKKLSHGSFASVNKVVPVKSDNNEMYAHLNDAKEWRMRVFRKPQRQTVVIHSARTLSEHRTGASEGKKPFLG